MCFFSLIVSKFPRQLVLFLGAQTNRLFRIGFHRFVNYFAHFEMSSVPAVIFRHELNLFRFFVIQSYLHVHTVRPSWKKSQMRGRCCCCWSAAAWAESPLLRLRLTPGLVPPLTTTCCLGAILKLALPTTWRLRLFLTLVPLLTACWLAAIFVSATCSSAAASSAARSLATAAARAGLTADGGSALTTAAGPLETSTSSGWDAIAGSG